MEDGSASLGLQDGHPADSGSRRLPVAIKLDALDAEARGPEPDVAALVGLVLGSFEHAVQDTEVVVEVAADIVRARSTRG